MSDDFNTAKTLAILFEMSSRINDFKSGTRRISVVSKETFENFKTSYVGFMEEVLGLTDEVENNNKLLVGTINVLIALRKKAREDKNFQLSDKIRDDLKALGVQLMDGKDGDMNYSID
jgi:cysteinyl-tRNA synthetase